MPQLMFFYSLEDGKALNNLVTISRSIWTLPIKKQKQGDLVETLRVSELELAMVTTTMTALTTMTTAATFFQRQR